jgi:hypothetical protein
MAKKRIYCDISKVEDNEDGTITVTGVASSGAVDSDGETVTSEAMKNAIPDYMKFGAVREMHQPSAAGTAVACNVDDATGKTNFSALVVDDAAIKKVRTGVYKGFSIGGKVTERDPKDKRIIKGLDLIEISLVDRPANPEALLTMYKAASTPEDDVTELAGLLDAGTVTPAQVLSLIKASQVGSTLELTAKPSGATVGEAGGSGGSTQNQEEVAKSTSGGGVGSGGVDPLKGATTPLELAPPEASTNGSIKKGLYSVSSFAQMLCQFGYLLSDVSWEANYEGDGSPIPGKLFAWLKTGTDLLKEMTEEETAELLEQLRVISDTPEVISMAAKAGLPTAGLLKVGAQFSAKTKAVLADVHKMLTDGCAKMDGLGYKTADDDSADSAATGDMSKAAAGDTIGIASPDTDDVVKAAIAPLNDNIEKLGKENADLKDQIEKMNARINAMPAPGKALLKAINKGEDARAASDNTAKAETAPPEGTAARAEYEMRKVFASTGLR